MASPKPVRQWDLLYALGMHTLQAWLPGPAWSWPIPFNQLLHVHEPEIFVGDKQELWHNHFGVVLDFQQKGTKMVLRSG